MSKDEILESSEHSELPKRLDRRELISKYGQYTAPLVVSLLLPSKAYGHVDPMQAYSTVAACAADAANVPPGMGNHSLMSQHCMFEGGGFATAHDITNP